MIGRERPQIPNPSDCVRCTVVFASSEDAPFPAVELNKPAGSVTRGWHTAKLCSYPQEIGFRFDGQVQLTHLQILSHECMIPTKVEVFVSPISDGVASIPAYNEARFTKLGFLTFISNEKSRFRARERKTVNLSAKAYFIKLVVHKCFTNQLNIHNQVGILKVDCYGTLLFPVANHRPPLIIQSPPKAGRSPALPPLQRVGGPMQLESDEFSSERKVVQPQGGGLLPPIRSSQQNPHHRPEGFVVPPPSEGYRSQAILVFEQFFLRTTRELVARKAQAIEEEDFDVAKACKEQLLHLQTLSIKIYELESVKVRGIYDEDFDAAKVAKTRMDRLCEAAYELNGNLAPTPLPSMPKQRIDVDSSPHVGRGRNEILPEDTADDDALIHGAVKAQNMGNARKNAFDDQPVQSAYAQAKAEEVRQKQHQKVSKESSQRRSGKRETPAQPPEEEDEENDAGDENEEAADEGCANEEAVEEEQEEDEEGEGEEEDEEDEEASEGSESAKDASRKSPAKSVPHKPHHAHPPKQKDQKPERGRARGQADVDDVPAVYPTPAEDQAMPPAAKRHFELEKFEDWERDVYFAIHEEASEKSPKNDDGTKHDEPMADPVDSSLEQTMVSELSSVVGAYTTACLFSKRFRLREASLNILATSISQLYKHVPTSHAVVALLKYLDLKGYGLLDPILNVFLSACNFIVRIVENRISDCPLSAVQIHVTNLLPRLLLRTGDSTQKSREEALALILCFASSAIGPERVCLAVVADPVDAEKRKIPSQSFRVHLSRLLVMKQLLQEHHLMSAGQNFDMIMNKLIVPCLNHFSNDVRETAISVIGCFDARHQQDVLKYLHLVQSAATRAAIEERLSQPPAAEVDHRPKEKPKRTSKHRKEEDAKQ